MRSTELARREVEGLPVTPADLGFSKKRHYVRVFLRELLGYAVSEDYLCKVSDAIEDEVFEDIDVSASKWFNCDDMRMAIGRVLCKRLGVES